MKHVVWTQWDDFQPPSGVLALSPKNCDLENDDLSEITFYVPQYLGGVKSMEFMSKMSSLKYLQYPQAGFDDALEYVKPGMVLCNAKGVHDDSTAELALGMGIAMRRGFPDFLHAQDQGLWHRARYPSFSDSVVALIGYGSVGKEIERKFSTFNVQITKFSRSGKDGSLTMDHLDDFLPTADIIVLIIPLNDDSRGLFDKNRLAKMKNGSLLINVSRGPVVDTEALLVELQNKRIFAALDVTDPEPLPKTHLLWKAPNLMISPHVGGHSSAFDPRCRALVKKQLERLVRGEEVENIVFRG